MLKGTLQKDRSMTSTQRSSKTVGLRSRRENILNAWPNVFLKISLKLDDQSISTMSRDVKIFHKNESQHT